MVAPALVTPVEVSEYTQGKVMSSDPRLPALIDGATAAVRRYCGWHVAPQVSDTMLLDGPGGSLLVLPTMRLAAVVSVAEAGTLLVEYDPVTTVGDYEWSENGEIRRVCGVWTQRYRGVSAAISHGYDSAPDVAQIVKQVVAQALSSPMGATREQAGALAVSWATTAPGVSGGLALLERDRAVLDLYRLRSA